MEQKILGKKWPGHGTCQSEMELRTDEPLNSSLAAKQWIIGAHQQSLKSKLDSFSEIIRSPVQCLGTHDDVSSSSVDIAFRGATLCSVRDDFNNNMQKRLLSVGKPRDSTLSLSEVLDKYAKTDSEKVIFPHSGGRKDFQSNEQVTMCSEDDTNETAVERPQNCISNTILFSSDPVETLSEIPPPDFPNARRGSSLDSDVLSPDLLNEVSPSSKCCSRPFSHESTQVLSAEVPEICCLKKKEAEGRTEMCTVESLLCDTVKGLGKVRSLEDVRDLPIQTNAEEEKKMPADSVSTAPLPGLHPITPVDSTCNASCPLSAEGVDECRTREDSTAGLTLVSVMATEAPQTPHETLHSPRSCYTKGPHPGKTAEGGAGVMSARHSASKAKPEIKTTAKLRAGVTIGKGAKEKKEKEKMGNERMRGPTVTRARTRGRMPTAIPELHIRVPLDSLVSMGEVERAHPDKATWMSSMHGFFSETESGRERDQDMKSPEQFVGAPIMAKNISGTLINKSAQDPTNCDYSSRKRSGDKTKVTRTTCVTTSRTRSKTVAVISCGQSSSVNDCSNRGGKALSEAELGSPAVVDGSTWSSHNSLTQSAKMTGCIEDEEKMEVVNDLCSGEELAKRPEHGVGSRGREFFLTRKRRMEFPSGENLQFSDVQVAQSEMRGKSQGNEISGQGYGLQTGMVLQGRNDNNDAINKSHEDTGRAGEAEKGDEEGILCSRDFQREWALEQDSEIVGENYLKEVCKIRSESAQGKESYERNTYSKTNLVLPKCQGQFQSTVSNPSDLHLESDVGCHTLQENTSQEFTQISLPLLAETRPLIPDQRSGESVFLQNNKEANGRGETIPILSIPSVGTSTKYEKRRKSRKTGTYRRMHRCYRGGKNTPVMVKEPQRKEDSVKILGSCPQRSSLKRRHSCPEINQLPTSPRPALVLAASPLGRPPCSAVHHVPHALPQPSSVKRPRRHTVCSLEVEREIAPLCLRKEVYPVGWGRLCPNLPSSPKILASCFLASPLAFLSSKRKNDSGNITTSCNSHNVASPSSCSFATPTPSCPANSSICHPLFPATASIVPTVDQSSASVSSFCSVPFQSTYESKLNQENAEKNGYFRLEPGVQERREEKSLSESEIKINKRECGKVSEIKIRKSLPKTPTNLTPMGLPKPVRLKKKEFSLEEIYTNKNFSEPPDGRLETIFEVPISSREGSVSVAGQRRIKRFLEFPEAGMPRKPRKPVAKNGVSRKVVESANLARTRRGGNDRTKEGYVPTAQEIESMLCSKLEQLDTWIALDEACQSEL